MSQKPGLIQSLRSFLLKGKTTEETEKEISKNIQSCEANNLPCQVREIMSNSALLPPTYSIEMFNDYANPKNLVTAEIKDRSHIMTSSGINMPEGTVKPSYNIMVHVPSNFICVEHFANSIGFNWEDYFLAKGKYFSAMEDRAEYYAKKHGCSSHQLVYWDAVKTAQGESRLTPVLAHYSLISVILYYYRMSINMDELSAKLESARFRRRFESKKFRREAGLTSRFLVDVLATSGKKTSVIVESVPSANLWAVQPNMSENLTGALAITKSIDKLADAVSEATTMLKKYDEGITNFFDFVNIAHKCLLSTVAEIMSKKAAEAMVNSGVSEMPATTPAAEAKVENNNNEGTSFPRLTLPPQ